jgi:hypothetical protein
MIPLPSLSESIEPIERALEAAKADERVNWMRGLGKRELVALWALAAGRAVRLDDLADGEGAVVIHEGQNSLPLFSAFQKRIVRRGEAVQGYNHQSMSWITGPGHFVVREEGGEAFFDYTRLPESVPSEFPALKPNEAGLSRLVYAGMIDRLRKVSAHALIGAAEKGGKATGDFFMLVKS